MANDTYSICFDWLSRTVVQKAFAIEEGFARRQKSKPERRPKSFVYCFLFVLLTCCSPATTYRVRLTADVEVSGKHYFGSSVREYRCHAGGGMWGNVPQCVTTNGEAMVVSIPGKPTLFFPLDENDEIQAILKACGQEPPYDRPTEKENATWIVAQDVGASPVIFKDQSDPSSVRPADLGDPASVYGPNSKLQGITAELTTSSPDMGRIEKELPWLKALTTSLDGNTSRTSVGLATDLARPSFIRGH